MKQLTIFCVFALLILSLTTLIAQEQSTIPKDIITATKTANSKDLAKFFNSQIELITPNKSGVYSKAQAEQVIKDFFETYPVTEFKIIHKGLKDNSSYAIGKYTSNKISFRFYFRIKKTKDKTLIHQIWIDNEDEQ